MARAIWLVIVLGLIAVVIAIPFAIRARFEGFTIPSSSMAPGLLPGDYILVDKSVREAARGHLIVFSDADKDWYKNYLIAVLRKLDVGGCYATHNVGGRGLLGRSDEYLTYLRSLPNLETTVDTRGAGMAISYKRS